MIQLNPQYEAIFNPRNIDEEGCEQARPEVKSMVNHFVDDEHFCYFDDMYCYEYSLQWIFEDIMKYDIDEDSRKLLDE